MNKTHKLVLFGLLTAVLITAASVQPQLSLDEQDAIVEAVVQTMNPDALKATIIAEVEADLIRKFDASGYVGLSAALSIPLETTEAPVLTEEVPAATPTPAATGSADGSDKSTDETAETGQGTERGYETNIADYYNGAVLQEDGTYRGLHAKQVNAYAYTIGESEEGTIRQFHSEFQPNVRFNLDVVFENDGSLVWPSRIEMRHMGNVGEYTGHTESVVIDRSANPVLPGDKCGFTISAHGSENLGWTTFYFQLFDADSGSVIEGGQGSFTYNAY